MNSHYYLTFALIISLLLISCWGKKKNPNPDKMSTNTETIVPNSSHDLQPAQFYELEESIEDIQKQIVQLQTQIMEYENDSLGRSTGLTEEI